ncbi:MAG: hypothetical protein ABSE84_10215, partial [Isosphaeraceae bacterium]
RRLLSMNGVSGLGAFSLIGTVVLYCLAQCLDRRVSLMRPQPIREIAPPAWPLPLISNPPRGPRRSA